MTPRVARDRKAAGKPVASRPARHQLTFRDVPPGLTRCLRCGRLLSASEFVAIPVCVPQSP